MTLFRINNQVIKNSVELGVLKPKASFLGGPRKNDLKSVEIIYWGLFFIVNERFREIWCGTKVKISFWFPTKI